MKRMHMQFRQGDVWIERVTYQLSGDAKPLARDRGRVVLAYGEVTGHAHAIDSALAELFEEQDGVLYLRVEEACAVTHEEHAPIALDPGMYRIIHQREYSPEEIRRVAD